MVNLESNARMLSWGTFILGLFQRTSSQLKKCSKVLIVRSLGGSRSKYRLNKKYIVLKLRFLYKNY